MSEAVQALAFVLGAQEDQGAAGGGGVLFLNAQPHPFLDGYRGRVDLVQWSRAAVDALKETGWQAAAELGEEVRLYDQVWLLPDRQKLCQLGELVAAWRRLVVGGQLWVSLPNDWGAKSLGEKLRELFPGQLVESVPKHHCRVFTVVKTQDEPPLRLLEWEKGAALQRHAESGYWTRPGLFSWDRVDQGSALLASELPKGLAGHGADLGMGWGWLSMQVLSDCEDVLALDGFELDARAMEAARRNLGKLLVPVRPRLVWRDVTQGVGLAKYDFVVMNPPFHEGRDADPSLGIKFILAAARCLKSDGVLWMVANKHLPYELVLSDSFAKVETVVQKFGFKVLTASAPLAKMHHQPGGRKGWRKSRG
jgi:16S rRNA (guanine1207-N2)-methyltransferase